MKSPRRLLAGRLVALAVCLMPVACKQQVNLSYVRPPAPVLAAAPAPIGQLSVIDLRGEKDPTWIGAVRGRFGEPIKVLHTTQPLSDVVALAFQDALVSRGLFAPGGPLDMVVSIKRFESLQYIRREANIDFVLEIRDHATGRPVFHNEAATNPVSGTFLTLEVFYFGSPEELRAAAQSAMNQAIDKLLAQPGLREALATGAAGNPDVAPAIPPQ